MNLQNQRRLNPSQNNIRVVREGHLRLSDRRPVQCWKEELPEPKINSSVSVKNSKIQHSSKMLPLEHHSADHLLDLSTASSSYSSLSVKSCFGNIGTLKVKVPASSLREVQNLPENMEISLNSTSTPRSLSPEFGCKKQVLVEKHSPSSKGFTLPFSSSSFDAKLKKGSFQNGLQNKTERKEFGLSDMFFTSTKQNQPGVITFSGKSSENSLKPEVLISNNARLNSKDCKKTVSNFQTCPVRIHQSSDEKLDQALENSLKSDALISDCVERDNSETSPKPVSDPQTRPIRIHQGSVATSKVLAKNKIPNNSNVQITNFSVLDSLAARKALLSKKTQSAPAPVRRTVPAKVITSTNRVADASEKDVCHSCKEKSFLPDAVSAVAAATAAAMSTQPLLSSQNKLESQLSMLLEKINALEQEAALKQKELENESKTQKITNLESQLNQVTEERMKNLEELQRQLFRMQTKFLSANRNFQKISDVGKCLPSECQKPTVTQEEKNVFINSSLNTSFDQELKNNPSMSSGYQTLSVPIDQQNSIPDDKACLESLRCENVTLSNDSEIIQSTKHFNSNNSGKVNMNSMGHKHTAKNIYVPFLEKKAKVSDHKVSLSEKTHASSVSSKPKGNVQSKPKIFKEASKHIAQKKATSIRNKVGSQEQHANVRNKQSKEKSNRSDMKTTSNTKQPFSVSANSRYSILKDFVSGRYSQQPYLVREKDNISKSTNEGILNASFTVDVPIVEKEAGSQELFSQVEINRPESNKDAPLEKYLLQSPDKSLLFTQDKIYSGQQPSLPSAEVLAGQETLRKAQTSRMVLEANLQMVERDHEKDAVYGLVDNLYEGSPAAHRLQLRRKVDQCIAKVQKDIQSELSQVKSLNSPPQNRKSSAGPLHGRNAPAKKITEQKVSANKEKCQDSDYLTKVFGKAAYQNKRTTVKNLYMRFQNQPKAKSPRPKETIPVKGVQMKSAKTQTPQEKQETNATNQQLRINYVDGKKYFFASSSAETPNSVNPQHGHLGFMAVALREPRMDSGLKMPVTIRAGDSLTMAPENQPKIVPASNVMLCNIPVYDKEQVTVKKRPALVKQTLPSVVIEAQQETSQPYKNSKSTAKETEKNTDLQNIIIFNKNLDEEADACYESSESIASSEEEEDVKDESLIILSGSNPKVTGGKTRITTTELVEKQPEEDILDSLLNQNFVSWIPFVSEAEPPREFPVRQDPHNEAFQWVEEEILSQIVSQHSNQPPPLPSSDIICERVNNIPENDTPKFDTNIPVSGSLQTSTNPPPYVDKTLISQLVEELLVDKINEMMKEALPEKTHHVSNLTNTQNESASTSEQPVPCPQTPELTPELSEKSLASPEVHVPLPCTPSASPEPLLEENSSITEHSIPNHSLESKHTKDLFQAAFKEEINRLREENFPVTHSEEGKVAAAADTASSKLEILVTPQLTPSLTPTREGSPITPASSPSLQLQNEGTEEHIPIRTPSPSIFSQDSVEDAVDIRQDGLQLILNEDDIPSVKKPTEEEEEISLKDKERVTVEAIIPSESELLQETGSVSTTESESETIFESLSVGQWLLSKSEGQAADFSISEKAYKQILNDASTASTLRDTEDLFHDETTDMTCSEGEVVFKSQVPPERDPILELVSQMQNRNPLTLPDAALLQLNDEEKLTVHRSLGELPLTESELNLAKDVPEIYQTDHFLKLEEETGNRKQPVLSEFISSQPDAKEENLISEKEIYVSQKGTRIIEVGKQAAEPSAMEATFSKDDSTQWKGVPSQIELGSISDSDQTNLMQKSVHFSEDGPLSSIDYAAYWESCSDLVTSDPEKLSAHSLHEPVESPDAINEEEPEQRKLMSVMIPQPDVFDEEDIEEISLGEEK